MKISGEIQWTLNDFSHPAAGLLKHDQRVSVKFSEIISRDYPTQKWLHLTASMMSKAGVI